MCYVFLYCCRAYAIVSIVGYVLIENYIVLRLIINKTRFYTLSYL